MSPPVPYVNRVCYASVTCLNCNHSAADPSGNIYATYLADSTGSLASDHFDVADNANSLSVGLYLARYGKNSPSGYGEYEAHLEGRHVSEVWAECASKWRDSLEYFNCGNDDDITNADDYILIAPWNLEGLDLRCNRSSCPNYQKADQVRVYPIHSRSAHVWASGN